VGGNSHFAPAAQAAAVNSYKGQNASSDDNERFRRPYANWEPRFTFFRSVLFAQTMTVRAASERRGETARNNNYGLAFKNTSGACKGSDMGI
ncbi:MAG: hypothetical protein IJS51_10220, partial [Treponema sp.]|nr:hypothetical protein [Treponema sp.]